MKNELRRLLCKTGSSFLLRRLLPTYPYMFNPAQLAFLCACLQKTAHVPGPVVEIGCNAGHTTIFLSKFLEAVEIQKKYVCIDTFGGFTPADIEVEVKQRAKTANYGSSFRDWTLDLFRETIDWNLIRNVEAIQADVNMFEERSIDPPSFCLVDVDLFRPTKAALDKFYPLMAPGSMLVVDDCRPNNKYDGAYEAYRAFVRENGLSERYEHDKFGIVPVRA